MAISVSNLCMNASCIKTRQRNLYRLGAKSLLGLMNIVASSVFVTLLKTNKILVQNSTAQQKALRNRMVAIILFCETVFNILPNMVAFFANILFNTILSKYAGWITMVGYSLDSFVMSIFYSATLFGRQQRASVGKNITKVAPANQHIKTVHGNYGRAE
uniref:G_PROTEIN_RECEP_F1_2 domain-containing protein n=1 Tax=Globodera pallida TaxID=36090 RepID=A0A183BN21_GLOPA